MLWGCFEACWEQRSNPREVEFVPCGLKITLSSTAGGQKDLGKSKHENPARDVQAHDDSEM